MKDPAVLFYISDWLTSTAEMDADARGWYLNLLLHNYDKKNLPNDLEKLAVLCNVRFSEYKRFEHVFEQVFKHKFISVETENGETRLSNPLASQILKGREIFKDKKSAAGKASYMMRFFKNKFPKEFNNNKLRSFVRSNLTFDVDLKNEQMLEQMFERVFELYRNENENENTCIENVLKGGTGGKRFVKPTLPEIIEEAKILVLEKGLSFSDYQIEEIANKFINHYKSNGWKVGKTNMKDWKAALAGQWISKNDKFKSNGSDKSSNPYFQFAKSASNIPH